MRKNRIKLTESYLHNIIKEVLNENWMTFMNAARGRKAQADAIRAEREKTFPHSQFASERNEYDDFADELEKHAQSRETRRIIERVRERLSRDGWI